MPLVYVHGVNTRYDKAYARDERARNAFFRENALRGIAANPAGATILNPYWGKYGASFRWNHASLPEGKYERFGGAESEFEDLLDETAADIESEAERFLVDLANVSMERAVDCLFAATVLADDEADLPDSFAAHARSALEYARSNPSPAWLQRVTSNAAFADKLLAEVKQASPPAPSGTETFGSATFANRVQTGVSRMTNAAVAFFVNPAARAVRPGVNLQVSTFIGDVLVYFASRKERKAGSIIGDVLHDLRAAAAARTADDSALIVVAHSLGAVIVYDILSSDAPDVYVDHLVTVGTQIGLFEELKLFRAKDLSIAGPRKVPRLPNVGRWINVMEPNDPLAYAVAPIFEGATDTTIDLQVPVWAAHTTYFQRVLFHERLAARITPGTP